MLAALERTFGRRTLMILANEIAPFGRIGSTGYAVMPAPVETFSSV
jgi:hypothetical protein